MGVAFLRLFRATRPRHSQPRRRAAHPAPVASRWLALVAATLLWATPSAGIEPERGTVPCGRLFAVSFDGSSEPIRAEVGMGPREMVHSNDLVSQRDFVFPRVAGHRGRALDLSAGPGARGPRFGDRAVFSARGNASLRAGTVSFWLRAPARSWRFAIRDQSNDLSSPYSVFELQGQGPRLQLRWRDRDGRGVPQEGSSPELTRPGWHHVALMWDERSGVNVWVDGQLRVAPSAKQTRKTREGFVQLGWGSVGVFELSGGAFDEFAVVDRALDRGELARLARDGSLDDATACRPTPIAAEHRRVQLGWRADGPAVTVSGPTRIRRVDPRGARVVRRANWRATDGRHDTTWSRHSKGYGYQGGGSLMLQVDPGERIDWLRMVGGFGPAEAVASDSIDAGQPAPVVAAIAPGGFLRHLRLDPPFAGEALSVRRRAMRGEDRSGPSLRELALLRVDAGASPRDPEIASGRPARADASRLAGIHRAQLVHWFAPGERTVRPFDGSGGGAIDVQPLAYWHWAAPSRSRDGWVTAVRLRLDVSGWRDGDRVFLRLHDPFNPWRALIETDLRIRGSASTLDVTLEFPPALWPAGTELLLTGVSERGGRIGPSSTLAVYGPDGAEASAAARARLRQQHRWLRDTFSVLSERRPWSDNAGDDRNLRIAMPGYDSIARLRDDLLDRHPGDRWTTAYRVWTRPRDLEGFAALPAELPERRVGPEAPPWARLQAALLDLQLDFVDWWIDRRQIPNGELGNGIGDDTDLVGDWLSLSLIHDPDGAIRDSLRAVADVSWKTLMRNGLNIKTTDVLHAYETGINVQPFAALAEYGNPVLIERMMATARRYQGYLLTDAVDGRRRLRGAWFGDDEVLEGKRWRKPQHELRILHPGMMLVWYNGHPRLLAMLREFHAGAERMTGAEPGLPHALFTADRDPRYASNVKRPRVDALWSKLLEVESLDPQMLSRLRMQPLPDGPSTMGNLDFRSLARHVLWRFTRDDDALVEALTVEWKRALWAQPMRTRTEQSGDRIALNKNLTDFMYLGGLPGARGHLFPLFAVSYEGFPRDLAALVVEDTPARLRWVGYPFESGVTDAKLRVWNLEPGRYEVLVGADRDRDGRVDERGSPRSLDLVRGEAIPVSMAASVRTVVEARKVADAPALWGRTDLAITREETGIENGRVRAVVHNVGIARSGPFEVRLVGAGGRELASKSHPGLDGIGDLRPKIARVDLGAAPGGGPLSVEIVSDALQITRRNDRVALRGP